MNKSLLAGLGIGTVIGSIATFFITRHVMKSQFNAYIDEQEAFFVRKLNDAKNSANVPAPTEEVPTTKQEDTNEMANNPASATTSDAPYEIESDEYGATGFDTKQIYMYTDGVITLGDDQKLTIDEAYEVVGKSNFRNIALSEDATIYIRNPQEGLDFRVESLSYDYYDDNMDDSD